MFVDNNAVLKLKFQRLHTTVVNSGSAARIIDSLFQERVLGEDDMYRLAICYLTPAPKVVLQLLRAPVSAVSPHRGNSLHRCWQNLAWRSGLKHANFPKIGAWVGA